MYASAPAPGRVGSLGVLLLGLAAWSGCASSGESQGGATRPQSSLTSEQLMETGEDNLLGAIRRLRPQWLRARGPARSALGPVEVAVFVDDVRFGGVNSLSRIRTENVASAEFIGATDATTRYGLNVAGGVISVRRR